MTDEFSHIDKPLPSPAEASLPAGPTRPDGADSEQPLLRADTLFCERDERILFDQLSFDLHAGQLMQIRGSNGSGKTTLLRILCGLNQDYEGDLYWQGEPIVEQRDVFQSVLLYIGHRTGVNRILTPRENLAWSSALQAPASQDQIGDALTRVGLRGYDEVPCRNLSAGQTQRVALARLLISPARLWILDEPFTTLDVNGVRMLEGLLVEHVKNAGAVLVTTHHPLNVDHTLLQLNLDDEVPSPVALDAAPAAGDSGRQSLSCGAP